MIVTVEMRIFIVVTINLLSFVNISSAKSILGKEVSSTSNVKEQKNCDLLLNRLRRRRDVADDDDAYINNLITSTLSKEKAKCIEKYNLQERQRLTPETESGASEASELRREVAKLKDLVKVIKDQRYILKILDDNAKQTQKTIAGEDDFEEKTHEEREIDSLRHEFHRLKNEIQNTHDSHEHSDKMTSHEELMKTKLDKQQTEISNLKHLLEGVLIELKMAHSGSTTTTTPKPQRMDTEMATMLKELADLEKKLSNMSTRQTPSAPEKNEVVGSQNPFQKAPMFFKQRSTNHSDSRISGIGPNRPGTSARLSASSAAKTPRAADDELSTLLNLLVPEKSPQSSIDTFLKSLDSESSDDDLEKRLLTIEKQVKRKKKHQLEEKLKSLERQLTDGSAQSKSLDDGSPNAELKRLLVKMITNKKKVESKSLDDDVILDELKELQKSIKSMSSDDDDLFSEFGEEKIGGLDINLNKLITAGDGGSGHRRRKLTRAQIQAIRKRIQAMKPNGDDSGFGAGYDDGYGYSGNGHGYGHGHGHYSGEYESHNGGGGGGDDYSDNAGGGGSSGYGNGQGHGHGGHSGDYDYPPAPAHWQVIPTNQFGTPLYNGYGSFPPGPGYPLYPGPGGPYQSSYTGNYYNAAPSQGNSGGYHPGSSSGPGSSGGYSGSFGKGPESSYQKQFFPATENSGGGYQPQPNSGTPGAPQPYQHPQQAGPYGPASVGDLKNQIYDLQGVINTFNKPEYMQKPEDKETVYNLNSQIKDLKGIINNLQEPAGYQGPQAPQPQNQGVPENYAPPPPPPPPIAAPPIQAPDQSPKPSYRSAFGFPLSSRYRKKRDANRPGQEEALRTLVELVANAFDISDSEDATPAERSNQVPIIAPRQRAALPNVFEDVNQKLADVRKQLDRRLFPNQMRRNNNGYGGGYGSYDNFDNGKDIGFKFDKKVEKKEDFLDKIFEKILDKIIKKVGKALPKIIEVIFGKLDLSYDGYSNGYGNGYGDGYGNNALEGTFHSMGISGILPLIIVKILTKIHYVFQYLQKYKFFKTFLVPALILLLVAGAVIFLVWWLQPNDEYENTYKQLTYEPPAYYQEQSYDMYRNRNNQPQIAVNRDYQQPGSNRMVRNEQLEHINGYYNNRHNY